jgi:transposase-like protein
MPWASKTVADEKREFVALAQAPAANIRALCRQFNVSPNTAYKLLRRYRKLGRSTPPRAATLIHSDLVLIPPNLVLVSAEAVRPKFGLLN